MLDQLDPCHFTVCITDVQTADHRTWIIALGTVR